MKIGKYTQKQIGNTRTYKRKNKHNKIYRGSLTKRQKNINENGAIITIAVVGVSAITYAFMMTSNNITIDGSVAEIESPIQSKLERLCVEPQSDGENSGPPAISSSDVVVREEDVKNEIIKQSKEFGLNGNTMLALAFCESGYNYKAKNPTSTARGVYQYLIGTWEETESAKSGLERNDYKANIREAMIDISNGENWRWKDCWKKIK